MMAARTKFVLGSRGSLLALAQSGIIQRSLQSLHPHLTFEIEVIRTSGDSQANVPVSAIGQKGVFTREIEEALLENRIDFAVHSLKDLPGELPDGLTLAAVPQRENPRDALISRSGEPLTELKKGAEVGTSSLRRQALLRSIRPDLTVRDLRGNLDTRLRKLQEGQYDAVVVAAAGMARLGRLAEATEVLDPERFVPAPGQGCLGIETRAADEEVAILLQPLDDSESRMCADMERELMRRLEGGCLVPLGAWARYEAEDNRLRLTAVIVSADGQRVARGTSEGSVDQQRNIVDDVEQQLRAGGAETILKESRSGYNTLT